MRRVVTAVVAVVLSCAVLVAPSAPAVAAASPTGANNWACKPSKARPVPVVLVHGTFGDQKAVHDTISAYLKKLGFCVYALDYGFNGTAPVASSAGQLKTFVDRVLKATRAKKVSLVGHSQGGTMPRYYIKNLGGASKVDDMIGLAPANHGTAFTSMLRIAGFASWFCQACNDLVTGSRFLTQLNSGGESPGAVSYTTIVSAADGVVTPYTSGYLARAANVTNIRVQDACPKNRTSHVAVPTDPVFIRYAVDALNRPGPARASFRPKCTW